MEVILTVLILIVFAYMVSLRQDFNVIRNKFETIEKDYKHQIKFLTKRIDELDKAQQKQTIDKPVNDIPTEEIPQTPKEVITNSPIIQPEIFQKAKPINIIPENNTNSQYIESMEYYEPLSNNVKESKPFDLENLFLGNLFNKIGGIILVLAICFLVKFSSNYIEFTPQLNITLGYIVSFLFMGYSIFLLNKETNITAEILSGVGLSGLLLSTYFGCFYYSLFPVTTALFISFLIVLSSFAISLKFNSFSTIVIGLFGGYLNPAVFNNDVSITLLFGYLIALNLISLAYTYKNGSKNIINCANIFFTTVTLAIFSYKGSVSAVYPIIYWLIYIAYDILTTLTKSEQSYPQILRWFNFTALIYITNQIFGFNNLNPIGYTVLGVGIIYGILYLSFKKSNEDISYTSLQSSLICLLLMTFYLVRYPYLGLAWATEGFLVSELYLKLKNKSMLKYILLFFIPSIIYLLLNYQTMFTNTTTEPYIICLIYIAQAGLMIYSGYRLNNFDKHISTSIKMLGFSIIYLYLAFYFNTKETFKNYRLYIDSIIASIYSINSLKLLSKNFPEAGTAFAYLFYGIAAIILTSAEIFNINDVNYVPVLNIKFAAYLILIAISIYFAKNKNEIFEYFAVILGLFSLVGQIMCIFKTLVPDDTMPLILTTLLIVYSGIILTIGILKDIKSMKQTSICLILLLLMKLILIDLQEIDAIFKLIACVIIGFILLGVSQYYQKMKR